MSGFFERIVTWWRKLGQGGKITVVGGCLLVIAACITLPIVIGGKKGEENPGTGLTPIPTIAQTKAPAPSLTPTPAPEIPMGEARSRLDGTWIEEEAANKRPYAIMFNNIQVASPQSGISEAKILYEALSEAGITRLMGIFEDLDEDSSLAQRIGSVRSARHYFASFADEYDAIFIHFGKTSYARKKIAALNLDAMDGTEGIGSTIYYRDKNIKAPHNAFASLKGIRAAIEQKKFRTEYEEGFAPHFSFSETDYSPVSSQAAEKITLGFSSYTSPYLVYDSDKRLYTRYQFGDVHKDDNNGEPLRFKNIIVQFVNEWDIDKNGYQTMEIEDASGDGYYITNGTLANISWKKKEAERFMRYYDKDGNELAVNSGKTFIAVFPEKRKDKLVVE